MATPGRSISTVLSDIVGNIQEIVRSEMRLAKTEFTEEVAKLRSASLLLGVGAFVLAVSVLFVLLAVVYALSTVMPAWAAALAVAAGAGVVAAVCCGVGIRKFKAARAAPKTAASLKENVEWAKQLTR
jgi:uncharacterized membrane protein YqjE